MAQEFDVASKLLLGRTTSALYPPLFGSEVLHWHNVELPKVENKRPDLLAETVNGEIVYIEIDSQNEAKLPRRMCTNYINIGDRFPGKPVNPILIYIGREPMRHQSPYKDKRLGFEYDLIDSRDFDGVALLAADEVEDNMLALLSATVDKEKVISTVLEKLAQIQGRRREDMALMLIILGGLRDAEEEIIGKVNTMMTMTDLLENKVLGPVLRDHFAEGERKGREEGELKGREAGERKVLILLLERRFGPLPDAARRRVDEAGEAQVTQWAVDLLSAPSLEDLLG